MENVTQVSAVPRTMRAMRRTPRPGPRGRRTRRLWLVVAFAVAGLVVGRLAVLVLGGGDAPGAVRVTAPAERPVASPVGRDGQRAVQRAVEVLHAWDAGRTTAYARGDPAALRRLYVPGSRAGARDLRILRAYAERGLVLRGLRTQVLAVEVTTATPRRLVLEVTDRRVGGRAVSARGGRDVVALPRDAPSTRVLAFHRSHGRWRVAAVSPA